MGAEIVLDDVHPLIGGVLRALPFEVVEPERSAFVPREATAQSFVLDVLREVETPSPPEPMVGRGDPRGVPREEPLSPSVQGRGDRTDLVHAQHDRGVVFLVGGTLWRLHLFLGTSDCRTSWERRREFLPERRRQHGSLSLIPTLTSARNPRSVMPDGRRSVADLEPVPPATEPALP